MTKKDYDEYKEIIGEYIKQGIQIQIFEEEIYEEFSELFFSCSLDNLILNQETNRLKEIKNRRREDLKKIENFQEKISKITNKNTDRTKMANYIINFNVEYILFKLITDIFSEIETLDFKIQTKELFSEVEKNMYKFNKDIEEQKKEIREHDKNMLTIMGIFLAIFSIVGLNTSFLLKVPSYLSGWQIIGFATLLNIIIVVSMSVLFLLINSITKK